MEPVLSLSDICLATLIDFVSDLRLDDAVERMNERLASYTGAGQVGWIQTRGEQPSVRLEDRLSSGPVSREALSTWMRHASGTLHAHDLEPVVFDAAEGSSSPPLPSRLARAGVQHAVVMPIEVHSELGYALVVLDSVVDLTLDEGWPNIVTIGRGFACAVRDRSSKLDQLARLQSQATPPAA